MEKAFFFFFFFLPLGVIGVKFRTKRKIAIQRTKRVCAGDVFYCHISLNKITASIFQKIHIRKKTLIFAPTEVFERWHKVQTRLQGRFTFWHERQSEKKPRKRGRIWSELLFE